MTAIDQVREVVEPLAHDRGLAVYDIEEVDSRIRITVVGGEDDAVVDLALLGQLNRALSQRLADDDGDFAAAHGLEVSSPGLERALRRPEHFVGAVGEQITLKTSPDTEGDRRVRGRLVAADDTGVVVSAADGDRRVRFEHISRARTVFDWDAERATQTEGSPSSPGDPTTERDPVRKVAP